MIQAQKAQSVEPPLATASGFRVADLYMLLVRSGLDGWQNHRLYLAPEHHRCAVRIAIAR